MQGNVRLVINVPSDPDNAQWKLEGQTLSVEIDIKSTIRALKEKIMVSVACLTVYSLVFPVMN